MNNKEKQECLDAWVEMATPEVVRMKVIRERDRQTLREKMIWLNLSRLCNDGKLSEQGQKCFNYYTQGIEYIGIKIAFWEGVEKQILPHNMLEQLQEYMTEWLENAWAYFGMEDFKAQGDDAKEEYEFFKIICAIVPKKVKKKTRRGGKKHKKKNN